jgi:pilus assembly protein FimV
MWPNGRLLRDYSVLLDPSKFSPQTADAAAQPTMLLAIQALNPDAFIDGNINR